VLCVDGWADGFIVCPHGIRHHRWAGKKPVLSLSKGYLPTLHFPCFIFALSHYRRDYTPGATYFFMYTLAHQSGGETAMVGYGARLDRS
jgi:hypothetical protein